MDNCVHHATTINDIFEEVKRKENTLLRVLVVFHSSVSESMEYRVAYFSSTVVANIWKSQMEDLCKKLGYEYNTYCDVVMLSKEDVE